MNSPICLGRPVAPVLTPCGHVFCWACLLRHVSFCVHGQPVCPLCSLNIRIEICKPVKLLSCKPRTPGTKVEMMLMRRRRGSSLAFPASQFDSCMKYIDQAEMNGGLPLPDRERDGSACVFSHYSLSDDVASIAKRQLRELHTFEKECVSEGDEESLVFVRRAITLATSRLEEGSATKEEEEEEEGHQSTEDKEETEEVASVAVPLSDGDTVEDVVFYQASNGEPVFLDSLNMKMMRKYGLRHGEMLPTRISATVLDGVDYIMDKYIRKRVRKTALMPLGTSFTVVELDLKGIVDPATIKEFISLIRSREAYRRQQENIRRQEELDADKPLWKTLSDSSFVSLPAPVRPPEMNETSFPTLESSVSSPSLSPPPGSSSSTSLERKRSYAEVARAAAELDRPLSIAAEADFPSLSASSSAAAAPSGKSKIIWGPQARKPVPAVLTRDAKPQQPPPRRAEKSEEVETSSALDIQPSREQVVEEESEEIDGGHMVMLAPKKGTVPSSQSSKRKKKKKQQR